jgi:predicted restriction endonuclease
MKLCNFASLDPAQQSRGIRGLSKVSANDRVVWDEFHADWNTLAADSEYRRERLEGSTAPLPEYAAIFTGETEATRQVRVRLAQRFFRRSVLASYGGRCCISDIALQPLLVASHVLPWSRFPEQRANPRNGICLSRLHDAAFDRGLITFDHEARLVLSRELSQATSNQVLNDAFRRFEGQSIRLPQKFRPNPEFVALHRETVFRS